MSPSAEQVDRGIRSQTVATEGVDEHWSSNEAEAILHQLANAFISSNQMFRVNPEVRGARARLGKARTGQVEAAPIDDAPFRESGVLYGGYAGPGARRRRRRRQAVVAL